MSEPQQELSHAPPLIVQCPRCLQVSMPNKPGVTICAECTQQEFDENARQRAAEEGHAAAPTSAPRRGQPTPGRRADEQPQPDRPGPSAAATAPAPAPAKAAQKEEAPTPPPTPAKAAPAPAPAAASRAIAQGKAQAPGVARAPAPAMPQLVVGMRDEPIKMGFYGPGSVGKTSLLASIPDLVLLQLESTPGLDIPRYPIDSFDAYQAAIRHLLHGDHQHKALGIDSADELEKLVVRAAIARANARHDQQQDAEHIEHIGGGYKKGYTAARTRFVEVLADLEALRTKRGMHIFFTAHDVKSMVSKPDIEAKFERYDLALHEDIGREDIFNWCDSWLLCNFVTRVKKVGKRGQVFRGVGGKERAIYTTNSDAYRAKNRFDLPAQLPFEPGRGWEVITGCIEQWRSPMLLRQAIDAALAQLGDMVVDVRGTPYFIKDLVAQELAGNPTRQRLAQVKNRLEARVAELEEQREAEADAAAADQSAPAGGGE